MFLLEVKGNILQFFLETSMVLRYDVLGVHYTTLQAEQNRGRPNQIQLPKVPPPTNTSLNALMLFLNCYVMP